MVKLVLEELKDEENVGFVVGAHGEEIWELSMRHKGGNEPNKKARFAEVCLIENSVLCLPKIYRKPPLLQSELKRGPILVAHKLLVFWPRKCPIVGL